MSASASARAGAALGSSASSSISIPANARKVVQDLKEIVKNSDDEIYAMLKECNMDPNETVQRLLSQDTFHEVKRKRDKKKENASKEPLEQRGRAPGIGANIRGGRSRGRGNFAPRYNNSEFSSSGGRGQSFGGRDYGQQQNGRGVGMGNTPSTAGDANANVQAKAGSTNTSNENIEGSATVTPASTAVPNGSSQYSRVVQGSKVGWGIGPGHATMADIVKSGTALHANAASVSSVQTKVPGQQFPYPPDGSSAREAHPYVEPQATGYTGVKQSIGMVGSERSLTEPPPFPSEESSSVIEPAEMSAQSRQSSSYHLDAGSSVGEFKSSDAEVPSTSISSSLPCDLISPLEAGMTSQGSTGQPSSGTQELSGQLSSLIEGKYNGRLLYQSQPQTTGNEKESGLEWRPKSPVKSSAPYQGLNDSTRQAPAQENSETIISSTTKMQQLHIHDGTPVIIPDHLQVPEAHRTHLNFGSFGDDFDVNSEEDEDDKKSAASAEANEPDEAPSIEQPTASPVKSAVGSLNDNYVNQTPSSPQENLVGREENKLNLPSSVNVPVSQSEPAKPESTVQHGPQNPSLSAMHNYSGPGPMPQLVGNQFPYDPSESQSQEGSRVPGLMSYSDPAANPNYFSPMFRPSSEIDARYAPFISASNKYNAGVTLMTGQGLSSSQESGNSIVLPASAPTTQASQTVGLAQGGLTIPQQHIPIHAYPAQHAGVPLTPFTNVFGIHYVPPSYSYIHSPFQHSYAGSAGYPQAPGSSYAPAAGAAYTSAGAAAMKYTLPQYKPGVSAGTVPHGAVPAGYGNFGTSPSGFTTINSAATTTAASGYDDVSGPHYKENNLFIPSQQQTEGSGVWIQNPPSRDMAGMQTNSYYNLLGQGQHTSFAHTQPMHAVPAAAYASLYHQSQSGSAPAVHQLLQQPQALGAVGGVGTQSGAYQQQQRGQLSWPPNY